MSLSNNPNDTRKNQTTTLSNPFTGSAAANTSRANDLEPTTTSEYLIFVWLDIRRDLPSSFLGALRIINDCIRTFTDATICLDFIKSSNEKIFLISSSSNTDLLNLINLCISVEAIFVLDPDVNNVRGEFPKLIGIFNQQEELIRTLRATLDLFEQIQLEKFVFEADKAFLWWPLWKEEMMSKKSKVNNKNEFIETVRNYYRGNSKRLQLVEEFDKSYKANDALRWCFRSPFPSRLLRYAFLLPSVKLLTTYRFMITDGIRNLQQQSKTNSHGQVYRGMKLSSELIDQFEKYIGQLVNVHGFFTCTSSRNTELQMAASPGYRVDLSAVLFKIDFDGSARVAEITTENSSKIVVFDIATSFRIVCVNRGTMCIIKMKTASEEGKKLALEYREKNKDKTVDSLLEELIPSQKPPVPKPKPEPKLVPKPIPEPTPVLQPASSTNNNMIRNKPIETNQPKLTEQEIEANEYLKQGDTNRAIAAYRRIQPPSVKILKLIGRLCIQEKKDYETSIQYYKQALEMQEQADEDTTDTLLELGDVYFQSGEYDLSLKFYHCALSLRQSVHSCDTNLLATGLTNMSNIHRTQKKLDEALDYAQRAWTVCESHGTNDDLVVARSLILLTNIHHDLGTDAQALRVGKRAVTLLEKMHPQDLSQSAELLNVLGQIEVNLGNLSEAKNYFERALKIYSQLTPPHPTEVAKVEKNLQSVLEMRKHVDSLQYYS